LDTDNYVVYQNFKENKASVQLLIFGKGILFSNAQRFQYIY